QICQEQQSQGAFAPLPADAIGGQNQSGQHDANKAGQRQRLQQGMAERGWSFPVGPDQQAPETDPNRRRARNQAYVIGAAPTNRHTQLTGYQRKQVHSGRSVRASPVAFFIAVPSNDSTILRRQAAAEHRSLPDRTSAQRASPTQRQRHRGLGNLYVHFEDRKFELKPDLASPRWQFVI